MVECLERDKVLDKSNIITVQTKEFGSIEVVPVDYLTSIPNVNTRPIVHAHWTRGKELGWHTTNTTWYCSNCGNLIRYNPTLRTYQKEKKPVEEINCFCRKCGAIMDEPTIW